MWVVLWPKEPCFALPSLSFFCSLPGKILFPAWENFIPCLGKYCSLGGNPDGGRYSKVVVPLVTSFPWLFVVLVSESVSRVG